MVEKSSQFVKNQAPIISIALVTLAGMLWFSQTNYLLFHTLAEMFSVVIAFTIFVLTWNSRRILNNGYLLVVGISFLFTAGLDIMHTLAFRGLTILPGTGYSDPNGANLATQLWLAARFVQSGAMAAAPLLHRRRTHAFVVMGVFSVITALLLASIFFWHNFPLAFQDGVGLTAFKRLSEYVIIAGFTAGMIGLIGLRADFEGYVLNLLLGAMMLTILSEAAFTEYLSVNDIFNTLGHLLKTAAFYLIYKAIVETGFLKPQDLLYRELAQREKALRESEAREHARRAQLEAIMDAVPAVVWIAHDRDARVVTGNRASYEILRMNSDQNQSLTAPESEAPVHFKVFDRTGKELDSDELPLQVAAATGQPVREFEESVVFEDGEKRYLFGNVTPLADENGSAAGAVGAFIDITARVEAEQAMQASERRFRGLFETMSEAFMLMQLMLDERGYAVDCRILEVNPALEADYHLRREQVVGKTIKELAPDLDPVWIERFARVAFTGETIHVEDHDAAADRYSEVMLYRTGELELASLSIDVSSQRRAEEAVREHAERLEMINRELARANGELQDFAFVASHDLQEPLRKIQAFGERLFQHNQASLDETSRDYFERMLSATARMKLMIDDLLSLSRVTTRGKPFEKVDLSAVFADVLSDLELRIERSGGQVEGDGLPTIQADGTQMHQLLQNLIGNALKFHRPDAAPKVRVRGDFTADQKSVMIYVEDNGIGFDEQYRERIFQPFQRLHGRGEFEGSGIGLAVCRKIVERHAGSITANSQPGSGSTFIVTLPVHHPLSEEP